MEYNPHFSWIGHFFNVDHYKVHIPHAIFTAVLLTLLGLIAYSKLRKTETSLIPSKKIGIASIFEIACEKLLGLMEGIIGPEAKKYFPFIATLFIFIFVNNLLGIIPGFLPPTDQLPTTLAFGICVLVYFNYVGFKTQGLGYLKHFTGPLIALAPIMIILEIIGIILVRPASLGLRLFGNMTGDHMVLSIFSELVPVIVPIVFMGLAIFVSFIQAFVFSLLSTIYISMSLPHDEHH